MRREKACALVCAMIAAALAGSSARAEQFTFVIDPAQSQLTLSGGAFSRPGPALDIEEQSPGSMVTSYVGSIVADITPGTFTFTGGVLDAQPSGNYLPGPLESDYGFQADAGNVLIGSMTGAARDSQFQLTSGGLPTTPAGSGFEFDVATSVATGIAGVVDFGGSPAGSILGALDGYAEPLTGVTSTSITGAGGNLATFATDGFVETLTLPLAIYYQDFVGTAEFDFTLEGTIVATRYVPEPATMLLLAAGTAVVIRRKR